MIDEETKTLIRKIKHRVKTVTEGLDNMIYHLEQGEEGEETLANVVEEMDLCIDEFDKYYQDIEPKLEELRKKLEELDDDIS